MKWTLLDETDGRRTFVLVFDTGHDPLEGLQHFAAEQQLLGSHFTALGALSAVTLGWWSWEEKDYRRIELNEQIEVLSLTGNITDAPDGSQGSRAHRHRTIRRYGPWRTPARRSRAAYAGGDADRVAPAPPPQARREYWARADRRLTDD